MNHLRHEQSPYLRQHADNPVDWHPWGDAALQLARRLERPILISIGYSTCHWCHVMARESFEDEQVAAYMNEYFVNIKADREERPDLDALYMAACEAITGRGGWPLNVFLTPEGNPFFAGTYFPPEPGQRLLSWMQALQYAAYNFYENRKAVEQEAGKILKRMARRERAILTTDAEGLVSVHAVEKMMGALQQQYDSQEGGFGHGAKFPNTMALELLLQYAWQAPSPEAYGQVKETVARLLQGGLHDVIGGGFARYTVDRQWRVPHFEKMLYDNALIARLLASLYKWPKAPALLEALEGALGFLEAELSHPDGGYCAGLDADTEGVEGRFYTWGYEELTSLLPDEPHWFFAYYNVSPEGNREGRNILYATAHIEAFASRLGQPADEVKTYLDNCRNTLAAARARRARPGRDEQVLLSWNALVVTAYAQAYGATGAPVYLEKAEQLLSFLDGHFRMADGGLRHIYLRDIPAFLDDYAYLIEAYIAVHAVSQRHELLEQAAVMVEETIRRFRTEQDVLFYYSQQSETILRHSPLHEEDMPAPNAVMAANMKRLGIMLGRRDWQEQAALMLNAAGSRLLETPLALASWGSLLLAEAYGMPEIAIVGPQARKTTLEANATFLGPHILMASDVPDETYPLLAHRWNEKDTLIYICRDYACQRPVKDVEEMVHNLRGEEK